MIKEIKIILIVGLAVLALGASANVMAQENTAANTSDTADAQIFAQDLGVSDPTLLPDSPFYFLKEWTRNIRIVFTLDNVKKAELESKFTNEKLIELKKLAENGVNPEKIKKATENYRKAVNRVKNAAGKIKDNTENNQEVNKFLEKFTNQQVLQEKILQKLETQVPQEAFEKIKEAREQHLEKFKDVMTKLEENKERVAERLKNALQNGDESNPEILEKIKEKMPEKIKEKLTEIKEGIVEKTIEKAVEKNENKNCPAIPIPPPDFCRQGKIKVERNDKGCVIKFKCVEITSKKECKTDKDCPTLNCFKAPCPTMKCVEEKCVTKTTNTQQ